MTTADNQLLSENDKKEQLSFVYASAVATACGYTFSTQNLDRDSTDITISSRSSRRASIAFQLKCTSSPDWDEDVLKYQLKAKNYNDLVAPRQTPLLLLVMELPPEPEDWLSISREQLVLKRCAWWVSIIGQPETDKGSKQVRIPRSNLFGIDAMQELIKKSETNAL
ncbi:DUF4365 domain-containing protein [Roseovarius sp. TE539]|uniref:DUF4365 domain-containing protein n=1 Tax=Roseovarius sp. TE539 TaxID=2249812 RepID=UPI000DDF99EF|nr:DUF4365 domain-containing protein [Roseovarius sp. TE539]RBI74013.1 DUF4365 domain-containing protein [Roseovarius sp. TE539]